MTNILRGKASSLGKLNMSTQVGWFPQFLGQRYNINILIVVILMFVMFFYLKYSKQGYEITVVGESENTARYAGINVKWVTIRTMIISGAICGLVGRKRPDHFHHICRWKRIYRHYRSMACKV